MTQVYGLVMPPEWATISLGEDEDTQVREVVDRMIRLLPASDDAKRRARLTEHTKKIIDDARRANGLALYLPIEPVLGVATPMSIVVAMLEPPDETTSAAQALLTFAASSESAEATHIDSSLAVRRHRDVPATVTPDGIQTAPPVRQVSYLIAIPGQAVRLLRIDTAIVKLDAPDADEILEKLEFLFDAIVTTVRFHDEEDAA
jgi:hypothetical protein